MNKAQFIQHMIVRTCPEIDRLPAAIAHAEQLWAGLTAAGYGDKKAAEPRDIKEDYYSQLKPRMADWFDRFWLAFNHKYGKQRAALRWLQIGELTDAQYQVIVEAARKEAARDFKGITRKYAEGWLSERRFGDMQATKAEKTQQHNHVIIKLQGELEGIRRLQQQAGGDHLEGQIKKLEDAIKAARQH